MPKPNPLPDRPDEPQPRKPRTRSSAQGQRPPTAGVNSRRALLSVLEEQLQTEQRLRRSEALLNETQALAKVGGWEYDVASGRMQWTNEVFHIYEISRDYDPGDVRRDIELYPAPERVRLAEAFQRAVEQGEPYDLELKFVTANGREVWIRAVAQAECREGKVIRVFGNVIDITERKRAERELQHKTELAQLLEQLARAANEAVSPEAAMETCLARICEHGLWALGRVAVFRPEQSHVRPQRSQWFCTEPARFGSFMRFSESFAHDSSTGQFIPVVLRDRIPVWLPELAVLDNPESGRFVKAAEAGLKSAFAFPVIVGGEVVAVLEFFATETRAPDPLLIAGTGGLASQFARMIERSTADETRAKLAAIVENSTDAVIGRALDGTVTTWNAAAERILGYTAAEAIGSLMIKIQPPGLRQENAERRQRILAGQPGEHWETVRVAKDGRRIDVAISVSAIKDHRGRIMGTAVILRDITGRKRAERELQHKTELALLLEQLARAANEAVSPEAAMETCLARICEHGLWVLGRVATFGTSESRSKAEYSQWFCTEPARFDTFMRYSDSHEVQVDIGRFVGTVLRDRCPVWLADLMAIDKPKGGRLETAVDAGFKAAFAFPVIVGGKVAAILEFFATETRPPDALLIEGTNGLASQFARMIERSSADEARARLAAIVENSSDAIISRAIDRTIISWNAAAERILGYTAAEAIGRKLIKIQPTELRQEAAARRRLILAGRPVRNAEIVCIAKNGRRIDVTLSVSPIRDSGGTIIGTATIMRDIAERKRAERALRDYAGRLQGLSRRLVAIEETERRKINRELHDRIGQNLAALSIHFNIIRSQLSPASLRAARAQFEKTQALLEATAGHARNMMADLPPPALDDYGLFAALRTFVESAGAHAVVPITVRGEDLEPRLTSTAEMALFRIVQGAIANANQHARAKRIEVVLAATPERVTLTIADDGVGFDPARVDPARPSWGLTIMRERAEGVGARLEVESARGNGTRVRVEIDRTR